MTLNGHFENGVVVLDEQADVPDGVKVRVEFASAEVSSPLNGATPERPTVTRFSRIIGMAKDLPPDASANVDHYLYGAPKR